MQDDLQARLETLDHDACVIHIEGQLGATAKPTINNLYGQIDAQKIKTIIFNLAEDVYINSGGIAVLLGIVTEARRINQRLIFVVASSFFRSIFNLMGLTMYAELTGSLENAVILSRRPKPTSDDLVDGASDFTLSE